MGRPRNSPDSAQGPPSVGKSLDFLDLVMRIPPEARTHLLIEEKARLEEQLQKINEILDPPIVPLTMHTGGEDE